MSSSMFWKVLGGAVVGVGAVAAAPFTGGGSVLGAATLAGSLAGTTAAAAATGAAAAGVAAGYASDKSEKNKIDDDKKNAVKTAELRKDAEMNIKMGKLKDDMARILNETSGFRDNFFITAFAVGISAAYADNFLSEEERESMELAIAGISKTDTLSDVAQKRIEEMFEQRPSQAEAWSLIQRNNLNTPKYIKMFTDIIEMVIYADRSRNDDEADFMKAWNSRVAA